MRLILTVFFTVYCLPPTAYSFFLMFSTKPKTIDDAWALIQTLEKRIRDLEAATAGIPVRFAIGGAGGGGTSIKAVRVSGFNLQTTTKAEPAEADWTTVHTGADCPPAE